MPPSSEEPASPAGNEPVFVVGCSRSGTTLLQSILCQHPDLVSFPETNILYNVLDDLPYRQYGTLAGRRRIPLMVWQRLVNHVGLTRSYEPDLFHAYLRALGREDLAPLVPARTMSLARVFATFVAIMDRLADGRRWVEKTPQNIWCVAFIERYVPGARFVHIVREGRENIASLHTAARRYEDFRCRFGGAHGLEKAIAYWNNSVRASARYRNSASHVIVRYEDVVAAPQTALRPVGRLLGIEIGADALRYDTSGIAFAREAWKMRASTRIEPQARKFNEAFSAQQRKLIEDRALAVDRLFPCAVAG